MSRLSEIYYEEYMVGHTSIGRQCWRRGELHYFLFLWIHLFHSWVLSFGCTMSAWGLLLLNSSIASWNAITLCYYIWPHHLRLDYIVPCCMLLLQALLLGSFILVHEDDQPEADALLSLVPLFHETGKTELWTKLKCCNHCTCGIHIGTQLIYLGLHSTKHQTTTSILE